MKNNRKIEVGQVRENYFVEGEYYVILSVGDEECDIKIITGNRDYIFKSKWDTEDIMNDIVVM